MSTQTSPVKGQTNGGNSNNAQQAQQLKQIEQLCTTLYTTPDANERLRADSELSHIFRANPTTPNQTPTPEEAMKLQGGIAAVSAASDFRVIGKHEILLSQSESDYAIHFGAQALLKIVKEQWSNLNTEQRLQLRNFVYNCIAVKGPSLQRFSINGLIKLLVQITKQAWCDDKQYHDILKGIKSMVDSGDINYRWIAFELLKSLVDIMQTVSVVGLTRTGRQESQDFRDTGLREIFLLTKRVLQEIAPDATEIEEGSKQEEILLSALDTALSCLSYDFDTTGGEDATDGLGIVHVPTAWTDTREETTVGLFFELYQARLGMDRGGNVALECAGRLANIRRAMFQEHQRHQLITRLQRETLNIMKTNQGLNDSVNFHSFCRLLSCLKGNFRLDEICQQETYKGWIEALSNFTKNSFAAWEEVNDSSLAYIMALWGAMVRPITMTWNMYSGVGNDLYAAARLGTYVPQILESFIQSRLVLAQATAQGRVDDDPLDSDDPPLQLEQIPMLAWLNYNEAAMFMVRLLRHEIMVLIQSQPTGPDNILGVKHDQLQQFVQANPSNQKIQMVAVQECRLAWLLNIGAGIIGGFANNSSAKEKQHDQVNAEIGATIYRLIILLTPSIASQACVANVYNTYNVPQTLVGRFFPSKYRGHLELGFLCFIDQFRRLYADPRKSRSSRSSNDGRRSGIYGGTVYTGRTSSWVTRRVITPGAGPPGSPPAPYGKGKSSGNQNNSGEANGEKESADKKGEKREANTYAQVATMLGLSGQPGMLHTALLDLMISKLFSNIRLWVPQPKGTRGSGGANGAFIISTQVAETTLQVLHGMAAGIRLINSRGSAPSIYSSGKLLLQSQVLIRLLENADINGIAYFNDPANGRARTQFFTSIARLLYLKLRETATDMRYEQFRNFMKPFQRTGEALAQNGVQSEQAKIILVGWARDLRGVAMATKIREHYQLFYEWLFPTHIEVLAAGMSVYASDPYVTTPILKLFACLVHNRAHRIVFPPSSAGGIILFRSASNVINGFSKSALQSKGVNGDPYKTYYKGVMICMEILSHLLIGGFVNFGIFELYGDKALDSSRTSCLRMCLEGESKELLAYPKVALSFFNLMEALSSKCVHSLATLPSVAFSRLMHFIEVGIKRADDSASMSCIVIDHIVSYRYECMQALAKQQQNDAETAQGILRSVGAQAAHKARQEKLLAAANMFEQHQRVDPDMLTRILNNIFNAVVMQNCQRQWSMSRPLLPLLLALPGYYDQMVYTIVQQQSENRKQGLTNAFKSLLVGVESNLQTKNRDTFTKNLYTLVRKAKES
jgi:hypothetical protein